MPKKNTWKSPEQIRAEREAKQVQDFPAAVKIMDTPLGKALRKPGATFRYWTNSSPANAWIESKSGDIVFHSDENDYKCPVRDAFQTLRSFMDKVDSDMGQGGYAYTLSQEFIARIDQHKLDVKTPAAKNISRPRSRI